MKVALSLVAVLLAVDLVRANIPVYSNPCSAVDQYYPYPNDYTKYIHCTGANTYEVMPCPAGLVWYQSQLLCNYPYTNNPDTAPTAAPTTAAPTTAAPTAAPTTAAPAPGQACVLGTYKEDACELNVFYQCTHAGIASTSWARHQCPGNLVFSSAINVCVENNPNGFFRTPQCGVPSCAGVAHGAYIPDPCNYSRFYQCSNGQLATFTCPSGLVFDSTISTCNWSSAVSSPPLPATCN